MPFKDEFKQVYHDAINPACEKANFQSLRVDELQGVFNINKKIIQYIFKSDAIIADLTSWNPNVFYELGVAHAIDNKTVMIIQEDEEVPFDVSNYRCIKYTHLEKGLEELSNKIYGSLSSINNWSQEPSNPVQDFKPFAAIVFQIEFDELKYKLKQTEILLKSSKSDFQALQRNLRDMEALIKKSVPKTELVNLQRELKLKHNEVLSLKNELELMQTRLKGLPLRSMPIEISEDDAKNMLKEKDFFDRFKNIDGKGLQKKYDKLNKNGRLIITEQTTGLTWQFSGSEKLLTFIDSKGYIQKLNKDKYAGFVNWRLPTLEEAMSLMRSEEIALLFVDPIFDQKQSWIWTSDQATKSHVWMVNFGGGRCISYNVEGKGYVRAVR